MKRLVCRAGSIAAAALGLFLLVPTVAHAADVDLVVVSSVPGYQSNIDGNDGEMSVAEFIAKTGVSDKDLDPNKVELFTRSFGSDDRTKAGFIFAARTKAGTSVAGFNKGFSDSAKKDGYAPSQSAYASQAVVTYEGRTSVAQGSIPIAMAAYRTETTGYAVMATGPNPTQALDEILGAQLAFAPAVTPKPGEGEGPSGAYRVGQYLLYPILASAIGFMVRRRQRKQDGEKKPKKSAAQPVLLPAELQFQVTASSQQTTPFQRVRATAEASRDTVYEKDVTLGSKLPASRVVMGRFDDILDEFAGPTADREWLRVGVADGWRLGRAALQMESEPYRYESVRRLPQARVDLFSDAYRDLTSTDLSRADTGRLGDYVGHTATALEKLQPHGDGYLMKRSRLEELVWRGVAVAFAEFEAFRDYAPATRARTKVAAG